MKSTDYRVEIVWKSIKCFANQNCFITFAALEPAKPLYNAQIGGSFFYYTYMKKVLPNHILPRQRLLKF